MRQKPYIAREFRRALRNAGEHLQNVKIDLARIRLPAHGGAAAKAHLFGYELFKLRNLFLVAVEKLNHLNEGDYIHDFVGPLGVPTHTDGLKKVCVVGGGVGCAIALPVAEKLHEIGCEVHSIVGFRNKDLVILEDEFKACSDKFILMTDDGSYGQKGVVTAPLEEMIKAGEDYDLVITIGPLIMMKFVVKTTKPYNIPTTVSMNPIMIDGTGMCGGCRLTVDGQTKFACVDGPDFDGFKVDFDEAMKRGAMYKPFERHAYEETCNLFKKEVE